ncbi:MAG: DUF423 domain-containing protein [Phycisphaerales bacterium]|nr:DUF423 domain-containing protein [Phycisphaerales bacterium]
MAVMWTCLAALSGFIAVAAGAFGDHGLRGKISDEMLRVWNVAAHYQLAHSIVMAALSLAAGDRSPRLKTACLACFLAGVGIFSGSLYVLALTDVKILGAITPIGGIGMLAGWALLAAYGVRCSRQMPG